MRKTARLIAGVALTALGTAGVAWAQDSNGAYHPSTVGQQNTWGDYFFVSAGGGVQYLNIPDLNLSSTLTASRDFIRHRKDSDVNDYGGVVSGEFSAPLGHWGSHPVFADVRGFVSSLDESDTTKCTATATVLCGVIIPTMAVPSVTGAVPPGTTQTTRTSRDVDYWGGAIEAKFGATNFRGPFPRLYQNHFVLIGADIRGLDQDNRVKISGEGFGTFFDYKEQLDTTYVGGFIGIGGEYNVLRALGIGLQDRLGLRSFITLRAGVYNANVDYSGRSFAFGAGAPPDSSLSLSDDEVTFIGTATLETRKQFGPRTSLSLVTDYEYYSYAPEMYYTNGGRPTRIDEDDVFGVRTALRLNIGLGPSALYPPPP